jgi:hypothetical protein
MIGLEQEIERIVFEGCLEGDHSGLVVRSIAEIGRHLKFVYRVVQGEVVAEIGKDTSMYEAVMDVVGCMEGTFFEAFRGKVLKYLDKVRRDLGKEYEKILYEFRKRWVFEWNFFFLHDIGYVHWSLWLLPASSLIKCYYLSGLRKRHFAIKSGLVSLRYSEREVLCSFMRIVQGLNERGWQ